MRRSLCTGLALAGIFLCRSIQAQSENGQKGAGTTLASGGAPNFDGALHDELVAMSADDQRVRTHPRMSPSEVDEMRRVDQIHERRMKAIIAKSGWPGRSLVGPDGSELAWLIVQHCSQEFEEECLPLLKRSVEANEASGKNYAYLLDRVLMYQGKPQVYGTQYRDYALWQIEDPAHVDDRRRSVGLGTLAEYVALMEKLLAKPGQPPETPPALGTPAAGQPARQP